MKIQCLFGTINSCVRHVFTRDKRSVRSRFTRPQKSLGEDSQCQEIIWVKIHQPRKIYTSRFDAVSTSNPRRPLRRVGSSFTLTDALLYNKTVEINIFQFQSQKQPLLICCPFTKPTNDSFLPSNSCGISNNFLNFSGVCLY